RRTDARERTHPAPAREAGRHFAVDDLRRPVGRPVADQGPDRDAGEILSCLAFRISAWVGPPVPRPTWRPLPVFAKIIRSRRGRLGSRHDAVTLFGTEDCSFAGRRATTESAGIE